MSEMPKHYVSIAVLRTQLSSIETTYNEMTLKRAELQKQIDQAHAKLTQQESLEKQLEGMHQIITALVDIALKGEETNGNKPEEVEAAVEEQA